jgi:hypothetical protein
MLYLALFILSRKLLSHAFIKTRATVKDAVYVKEPVPHKSPKYSIKKTVM